MKKFIAMLFSVAMFVIAVDTPASTTRSLDDGLVAYYPFNGNANIAPENKSENLTVLNIDEHQSRGTL